MFLHLTSKKSKQFNKKYLFEMLKSIIFINFIIFLLIFYTLLFLYGQPYIHIIAYFLAIIPFLMISWTFSYFIYDIIMQKRVQGSRKAVLITGCSSGFGLELAKRLDKLGFTIFACVRNTECDGAKILQKMCSERLQICKLDVTSKEQIEEIIVTIEKSELDLWALVNNAGMALGLPIDWGNDIEQYENVFEVNLFGVVRLTKACLPLLRKSKGRIINVGSYASRVTMPFLSAYCMSKHAQRVFTNSLRLELTNDDIKVIGIEPIFYKTPILNFDKIRNDQMEYFKNTPKNIRNHYDEEKMYCVRNSEQITQMFTRQNINEVINLLVKAVTLCQPKIFYRCCGYFDIIYWAASCLPEIIVDSTMHFLCYNHFSLKFARIFCKIFRRPFFEICSKNNMM